MVALVLLIGAALVWSARMKWDRVPANVARWRPEIEAAAADTGMPARWLAAQILTESSGNPGARGSAGEVGLMQIRPVAVADLVDNGLWPSYAVPTDAAGNILAGARFLALQRRRMGNLPDAIRAYNAGAAGARNNPNAGRDYFRKVAAAASSW